MERPIWDLVTNMKNSRQNVNGSLLPIAAQRRMGRSCAEAQVPLAVDSSPTPPLSAAGPETGTATVRHRDTSTCDNRQAGGHHLKSTVTVTHTHNTGVQTLFG
ncbi:hypothetical protein J6590_025328 [Homalodisca vitripennis]|nr:hypothetical protein J6590_025328 [Homalodisca vitripennis]